MDWRFEQCDYHEKEKVLYALLGLKDYASVWQDKLTATKRRCGLESPQDVKEDEPTKMGQFLKVLNEEIAQVVELHLYYDIEELVAFDRKVEKNLQRSETNKKPVVGMLWWKWIKDKPLLTNQKMTRELNILKLKENQEGVDKNMETMRGNKGIKEALGITRIEGKMRKAGVKIHKKRSKIGANGIENEEKHYGFLSKSISFFTSSFSLCLEPFFKEIKLIPYLCNCDEYALVLFNSLWSSVPSLMDKFWCHNDYWLNKLYNLQEKWGPTLSKDFSSGVVLSSQMSKATNHVISRRL
ncbi:hypothetical protein M9H77_02162 [Catharanthus roseus]|uniref:Uncharacterized protein n=1 Tax=Catharanthus roseus TaxID=4058 RepID=A0ACC0C7S0_CATRO|nr:hypothetical protein M9H77_02162 [Catharanthus roseus]